MSTQENEAVDRKLIERIADAIRSLKFGSLEIVVHDGRVVQFERRERVRLGRDESSRR